MSDAKFLLGETVMTKGVMELLTHIEILILLLRHALGDWGNLCEEDKALNEDALITKQNRLFSSYETPKGKVWIITEYDYSATTVLLPNEY